MKRLNYLLCAFMVLLLCATSCTEHDSLGNKDADESAPKKCLLDFNVSCTGYDAPATRDASSSAWTEGDIVYFTFDKNAYGMATYTSGQWAVEYFGTLDENQSKTCKAVYFNNPKSREGFQAVNLTHETAIYEDTLASYQYDGALLTVTANLQPKTGRMRFKGALRDTIHVYGLSVGTRYSVFKGEYADTMKFIQLVANTDGYTPYIYGAFPDTASLRLNVATSTSAYTRVFPDSVMSKGESGWLTIPTDSSHTAWQNKMIFKVKTTEFAMMPVTEGGYLSFMMGETEVTKGLYNAVTDSIIIKSDYPQPFDCYNYASDFITQLNAVLGVKYKLPTRTQWNWAYKGGEKSLNYTYSGSNVATEVGWDSSNSGDAAHQVATLMPNELGIYDMYGNLGEWNLAEKNYNGYYDYYYKKSSFKEAEATTKTATSSGSYSNLGVRLSLSFK